MRRISARSRRVRLPPTVDSIRRTFRGSVTQVRKKPQEVQNVVTYTVVLDADNSDLRLLPGMTAAVEVKVSERRA